MEMQSILDRFRVPTDTSGRGKNRGGWINMQCPYCGRDPYLGYCVAYNYFSCWNCGYKNVTQTVQLLTNADPQELRTLLVDLDRKDAPLRQAKPRGKLELPVGIGPLQTPHTKYLHSRGFDPKQITKMWDVLGINFLGGSLAWRLFIPVYMNGEMVSWTTRRLTNDEPRYLDARDSQSVIPIKDTLYGIDHCRNSCIILEGNPSVWCVGPGSVGTFGLRVSPAQLKSLSRFPVRCICFDAGPRERAAERKAKELADQLSVYDGQTYRIKLESGKDPETCDPREIEEIRKRFLR